MNLRLNPTNPDAYYEPNLVNGPQQDPSVKEPPLKISGDDAADNHREGNDDYSQVTALFNLSYEGQKSRLFSNIAEAKAGIPEEIAERQLGHFHKVHPNDAAGVRAARASGDRTRDAFHQVAE